MTRHAPRVASPLAGALYIFTSSWLGPVIIGVYGMVLAVLVMVPGPSLLERLRWLDSGICAQMASHSFYPGGEQLPLCARNTGIYLGFLVTLPGLHALKRGLAQRFPTRPLMVTLATGVLLMAIDGLNSFFVDLGLPHLYQPTNMLRLATGLLTGVALATFTQPVLNRLCWCDYNEQRVLSSWKDLLPLAPVLVGCFLVVSLQPSLALYPIALLSTMGLLLAVSSVNLIVLIAMSKRDESFTSYRALLPFFALASLLAIGELLALAQLKVSLLHALGL